MIAQSEVHFAPQKSGLIRGEVLPKEMYTMSRFCQDYVFDLIVIFIEHSWYCWGSPNASRMSAMPGRPKPLPGTRSELCDFMSHNQGVCLGIVTAWEEWAECVDPTASAAGPDPRYYN